MRKKTVAIVIVGLMAAGLLGGCGNKTVTKVDEDTVVVEETPVSSETEEETEEETETETEEETEEVTEAPEPTDILAENGIVITPQAQITSFQAGVVENDEYTDNTIAAPVSVTVTTTPSDEEGYADTVATYEIHFVDGYKISWSMQPFDRYTGYALDASNSTISVGESVHEDVTLVDVDGTQYDISCEYASEAQGDEVRIDTVTLHHPIDYDGAVFAFGGNTATHAANTNALDYSNTLLVTDYPEFLHGYEFFCTVSDQ